MLTRLFVALALVFGAPSEEGSSSSADLDTVNYVLGTQTIGVKYQFTGKTSLVETAERILTMGSNILKFSMSNRTLDDHYGLPRQKGIRSLADMAHREPSVRAVLDMPFAYYHIWVYPLAQPDAPWLDGLSPTERDKAYAEVHGLATYLLTTYRNTGKTFFLGHWEGDWYLHPGYDPKIKPDSKAIAGMIEWLNLRQKAIDDVKRQSKSRRVKIYHYTEVNLVQKAMRGGPCLVNSVLPHTPVDYVSYSSYDTINSHRGATAPALHAALDYIESKLKAKEGIPGKRVFIGEYGFPLSSAGSPQQQDRLARDVCGAGLSWGCPFVLYWEMYCNEIHAGRHRGFWLIDDQNRKQPFYHTLADYYRDMRQFVAHVGHEHKRLPTDVEIRKQAVTVINPKRHRLDPKTPEGLRQLFAFDGDPLPLVSAHRGGARVGYPENCIATFEKTLEATPALMEVDPRYTKDGFIVLHHDSRLERTTNGKGRVADFTLQELKKLRLKDTQGNSTVYSIPTLDEALAWARGKTILVLDQKTVPLEARVKAIEENDAAAYTLLIVYSFAEARSCYSLNPDIMMEVMIPTRERFAAFEKTGVPWSNVVAFVGHAPPQDPGLLEMIHAKGARCIAGSSRNIDRQFIDRQVTHIASLEGEYRRLTEMGVDLIETDLPAELGRLLYP